MKHIVMGTICVVALLVASVACAQTVTNTISWPSIPANAETILLEKQVDGGAFNTLTTLTSPLPLQYVDPGNTPGINICYRATPSNSLPSTGAPSSACSLTIGVVGDMPQIVIVPTVVP